MTQSSARGALGMLQTSGQGRHMEGQDVTTADGNLFRNFTSSIASRGTEDFFRGFPGKNSPYTTAQVSRVTAGWNLYLSKLIVHVSSAGTHSSSIQTIFTLYGRTCVVKSCAAMLNFCIIVAFTCTMLLTLFTIFSPLQNRPLLSILANT